MSSSVPHGRPLDYEGDRARFSSWHWHGAIAHQHNGMDEVEDDNKTEYSNLEMTECNKDEIEDNKDKDVVAGGAGNALHCKRNRALLASLPGGIHGTQRHIVQLGGGDSAVLLQKKKTDMVGRPQGTIIQVRSFGGSGVVALLCNFEETEAPGGSQKGRRGQVGARHETKKVSPRAVGRRSSAVMRRTAVARPNGQGKQREADNRTP